MKTDEVQYYIGTVTKVLDKDLYTIEFCVPGVIKCGRAFPFRGEIDEPQEGNAILVRSFDPTYGSYFLYSKLKENKFIGFRSRGKMIKVTEEDITICTFNSEEEYPDSVVPQDDSITGYIKITKDGNITIKGSSIKLEADDITLKASGDIISDSSGNTIKATKIKTKGNFTFTGGTVKASGGKTTGSPLGPFANCNVCPITKLPCGTTSFTTI